MLGHREQEKAAWTHGAVKSAQDPNVILNVLEDIKRADEVEGLFVWHRSRVKLCKVGLGHAASGVFKALHKQLAARRA